MSRLLVFSEPGFTGTMKEFTQNDPDLTLNGDDFVIASAIVLRGNWTLYDEPGQQGNVITLNESTGPNSDGGFKDHADWNGNASFHVKSIYQS